MFFSHVLNQFSNISASSSRKDCGNALYKLRIYLKIGSNGIRHLNLEFSGIRDIRINWYGKDREANPRSGPKTQISPHVFRESFV